MANLKEWLCKLLNCCSKPQQSSKSLQVLLVEKSSYGRILKIHFIYNNELYYYSAYLYLLYKTPSTYLEKVHAPFRFFEGEKLLKEDKELNNLLIKWGYGFDIPRENQTVFF